MSNNRLRELTRIVGSAATSLLTWQNLMRSSGPDAPIQVMLVALSSAVLIGRMVGPPNTFAWEGPGKLDLRTRLGFLLSGMSMLGCVGNLVRAMLLHHAVERQNRVWRRRLARRNLWKRLTATAPHSRPFSLAATAVALLTGLARYRSSRTNREVTEPLFDIIAVLGQLLPTLPIIGLAWTPRTTPRRRRALIVPILMVGLPFGINCLRNAFMSQRRYEETRRRREQMWKGQPEKSQ